MNEFSKEDLINLLSLVNSANIKGTDATTVAILQQKIQKLLHVASQVLQNPISEKTV